MKTKFILLFLLVMILTGCSKTVAYKYNDAESQNGDWSVKNGRISVKDSEILLNFNVKYLGDTQIEEGNSWTCKVFVCENNKELSMDEADVIFTQLDINGKVVTNGDTKVVSNDNDIINTEKEYDFSSVYLEIIYNKNNEVIEDIIELSLID